MHAVRSILWIGSADRFSADLVGEAPALDVVWERDVDAALRLPLRAFDAVVLDAARPDQAAPAIGRLCRKSRRTPILVRLDAEEAKHVPSLLTAGARGALLVGRGDDPVAARAELLDRLEQLVRGERALPTPPSAPRRRRAGPDIIGRSEPMQQVFALVESAAHSRATVLVTGETGTGKELIAQAVHQQGPRRRKPFVAINCAAFPDTLLESELFGHTKGAYTGADREKKGLFESADGGSLFLDEVSETSGPFQAKLLRALQEREVRPLGGARARKVDVRVIAASNRDLWHDAAEGRFRQDLYYRLAVFPIHVPPLRERPGDIRALAEHFLAVHARAEGRAVDRLTRDATHLLESYHWPGNVRELENEIQRALALAREGEPIAPSHLSKRLFGVTESVETNARLGETLRQSLARVEALLIRRALAEHDGRRAATARALSITREGLYNQMGPNTMDSFH